MATRISRMFSSLPTRHYCFRLASGLPPAWANRRDINTEANYREESRNVCPQPSPWTHPHLLGSDEVTPGINRDEYKQRRTKLVEMILETADRSKAHMAIIPSASKVFMSGKIPYVFRQQTDFYYLTGSIEPDLCLILTTVPNSSSYDIVLFVPKIDPNTEVWEGKKMDEDLSLNFLGIDKTEDISSVPTYLSSFFKKHRHSGVQVWYDPTRASPVLEDIVGLYRGSSNDIVPLLHQMRLIKSKNEQNLMRKTCQIISSSVQETMKITKPSLCESQLWATVDYFSRMAGAQYLAYPPVVAGGPRANIIHYTNNNQLVNDGEMILMDAGCQFYGYSSDLTRCWPVNGRFSVAQREAYEAVLDVQTDLIHFCHELPSLDNLFQRMCRRLGRNLSELGFGRANSSNLDKIQMAYSFCPHHVSHYLGLDVHDTGRVKRNLPLQPGMVITIEPGLYVDLNQQMAPERYHGIGIRIEDDILITDSGNVEVLTRNCPKTVHDIEQVMVKSS